MIDINLIIGVSELLNKVEVDGSIQHLRIKLQEEDLYKVIKINRIIDKKIEKRCVNIMFEFTCSCLSETKEHIFILKYDVAATTWYILKQ